MSLGAGLRDFKSPHYSRFAFSVSLMLSHAVPANTLMPVDMMVIDSPSDL